MNDYELVMFVVFEAYCKGLIGTSLRGVFIGCWHD
jgi:hypothetical protein